MEQKFKKPKTNLQQRVKGALPQSSGANTACSLSPAL